MKRIMLVLSLITTISIYNDLNKEKIIIPKDSIRFRVIASSNSKEDQKIKKEVAKKVQRELMTYVENDKEKTKENIINSIPTIKDNLNKTLNSNYTINYGKNYFPTKEYKGVVYKEGNYESLVIKIGKGEGNNFWCVLFPPLCSIESSKEKDIEYHYMIKDIIKKYINR